MSTKSKTQVVYGLSQPLVNEAQIPIISQRIPTTSDKAQIGTIWIDQATNAAYILTSIVNNMAMWEGIGGPASALTFATDTTSATPSGDVIKIAGGANINTSGLGNIVTVNLDETVVITGSMTADTGFITTAGNLSLPSTNVGGTEGAIEIDGEVFANAFGANTFLGLNSGSEMYTDNGTGMNDTGIGNGALQSVTSGSYNTSLGSGSLLNLDDGSGNTVAGYSAGANYEGTESYNIIIGANVGGTTGESNVIRIGNNGSGSFEQNECYIAGITGNTVTNAELVTINSATGQMGVTSVANGTVKWQTVTGATQLVVGNGYFVDGSSQVVLTLPATANVGDTIQIMVIGPASPTGYLIAQNALQNMILTGSVTTIAQSTVGVTGYIKTAHGNSGTLVCNTANTQFVYSTPGAASSFTVN